MFFARSTSAVTSTLPQEGAFARSFSASPSSTAQPLFCAYRSSSGFRSFFGTARTSMGRFTVRHSRTSPGFAIVNACPPAFAQFWTTIDASVNAKLGNMGLYCRATG